MPPSTWNRLGRAIGPHRRRIALLVLAVAVVVVGGALAGAVPREVRVRYLLGPSHAEVTEVRVAYVTEGNEEVQGVRFTYPEGAPERLEHRVRLAPGSYRIVATLSGPGGSREVRRALTVPTEARVDVELFDLAYAALGGAATGGRRP